jgi:alanyl-tRNA synthetase
MSSEKIRQSFLEFFKKKGHKIVPSSSLIPDDSSVLLTTAGMQQFKKYFTGELDAQKDFGVKNTVSIQKCFRTSDIDEVGDKTHLTFFQMLGHFSFGDYFKKETIKWTFELLTDVFKISPERITARVFEGSEIIPFDKESFDIWSEYIPKERILKGPKEDNFWGPVGNEGPCGACNEVYVDNIEVATLVFIEYYRESGGNFKTLPQRGVDVGWGFERLVAILNNKESVFGTDIFKEIADKIKEFASEADERAKRILIDHLRASVFLIADGVRPSNKEAGYILRRLLRRILAYSVKYDIHADLFPESVEIIKEKFGEIYPEVKETKMILEVLEEEKQKFGEAVGRGIKEIEKYPEITGKDAFYLYETFGLPFELIKELAPKGSVRNLSKEDFDKEFEKHQQLSRTASTGMFKGGLVDTSEQTVELHTAAHLLMESLRRVLGNHIMQKGSNINAERLRLDFSHPGKLTSEQIKQIEDMVNEKIKEDLAVVCEEMTLEEAKAQNATGVFEHKYGEKVKVYSMGDFSKEICGGPHVQKTGELGHFKIIKEEASSSGVRRIKAILG